MTAAAGSGAANISGVKNGVRTASGLCVAAPEKAALQCNACLVVVGNRAEGTTSVW